MKQLTLWDDEPSEKAQHHVQRMFHLIQVRRKRWYQFLNCLFWTLAFIVLMIICLVLLVYVNSVQ